jgi:hypothetical protein
MSESSENNPILESFAVLRDPEAMMQITEMMQDPDFQEQMRQAVANPMVSGLARKIEMDSKAIHNEIAELMQDPAFVEQAKLYAEQMRQLMQDPAFKKEVNRVAEEMMANLVQPTRQNALASLLLSASPAAARLSNVGVPPLQRSSPRHLSSRMEEGEPSDKAVTLGAAALGAAAGVWLTGELTSAALLSAAAAYATTLDNGVGSATKSAGSFAAKAYDKTIDLNEQYDLVPKAKGAADTIVGVADNLNRNYGVTDKIDEKLKLSAAVGKVTDKFDEVKDSVTSKVDDISAKAKSS